MPVVVVAQPKGGVGKSTLATQIAGYWAHCGHAVLLGDSDRQQSASGWLAQRPASLPAIGRWELQPDFLTRPPAGASHVVIDTPAGAHGWRLGDLLRSADKLIVPLQPGRFDMAATHGFLAELRQQRGARQVAIGLVGMRVNPRTLAAAALQDFVAATGLPLLAGLRSTQTYVRLAEQGRSLFDEPLGRVAADVAQWQGLLQWLDA